MTSSLATLSLYYIKQIDSMLLCVCSVIDHRRRQNVVRTSVTHSPNGLCTFSALTGMSFPGLRDRVIAFVSRELGLKPPRELSFTMEP